MTSELIVSTDVYWEFTLDKALAEELSLFLRGLDFNLVYTCKENVVSFYEII